MRCPACKQEITVPLDGARCPLCGAGIGPARQHVLQLYIICGAIFASVLMYGVAVALLETTGYQAMAAPVSMIRTAFLALCVLMPIPLVVLERRLLDGGTVPAVKSAAVVVASLCESIAVLGLVLYLLGGGVKWFAIFTGLSFVSFLYLASRIPLYAGLIDKYMTSDSG